MKEATAEKAAKFFGPDVIALATLLHLAERGKELNDGPFKAGWDSAIEEAGAYLDGTAEDSRDTMQTLMEQVIALMNGCYKLVEVKPGPIGVVANPLTADSRLVRAVRGVLDAHHRNESLDIPLMKLQTEMARTDTADHPTVAQEKK